LHKERHNLYSSPYTSVYLGDKIKGMRQAGLSERMGEMRNYAKILIGKLEGKRLLGRAWR